MAGEFMGIFVLPQKDIQRKQIKEGDPAKKFPATRPFAIEQVPLMDIISEKE